MEAVGFKYLKFIPYINVNNWSSYFLLSKNLLYTQKYPFVRIGDLLKRNKTPIIIEDKKLYKRATIRINGNGISLRDEVYGIEIGTKNQFLIETGQFLLSKIDARNGAFGVVPKDLNNGVITGNFWTFDVDYLKINPHYLTLLTGTKRFQELSQTASVGTTNRNYLQEEMFLNFEIPLPTISEQQRMVNAYYKKIEQAKKLEEEAIILEKSIEEYLFEELGIENRIENKRKGLKFIRLFEIDRWDIWNKSVQFNNSNHNIIPLKSIIKLKSGNFLPASKMQKGSYNVYGGNGKNGEHNEYFLEGQRLIIGRVGEYCGNVHLVNGKYWITDNAFIVDKISNEVTYEFLEILLKHINLNKYRVLSAQPSISQNAILELKAPIPMFNDQKEIVSKITDLKDQIKAIRNKAEELKAKAEAEFEAEIFG